MLKYDTFEEDFGVFYTNVVIDKAVQKLARSDSKQPYYQCTKTWEEVAHDRLFLGGLVRYTKTLGPEAIVWLQEGDPYKPSKPFTIVWIGVKGNGSITIVVRGQQTARITKKWPGKLAHYFGRSVEIVWEVKSK